ncbi:MAG: CHAT domain-containing tetratricopeptide repeat protein [Cyanobacteria bacterium P01_C01_bin.72]
MRSQNRQNLACSLLLCCFWGGWLVLFDANLNLSPTIAQPISKNKSQADRDYQIARETIHNGGLLAAKNKLNGALRAYQALGDRSGQYNCQIELARIDYKSGKYQQARSQLRLAAQLNHHSHLRDGRAKTLLGLIAVELGDYHQALNWLKIGVHELRVSSSSDRLGRQNINEAQVALGEVYLHQGLYRQAEHSLYHALRVAGNSALRRRAFNALGAVQLEIGQYADARVSFEQAAGVANTPGDYLGKAKTLENLGKIEQLAGDKRQALKQYQLALNELRRVGAWSRQVYVLNNLGLLALDLGLTNRALEYFQSAEGTLSSSGGVGRVITYINLGYYYSQRKNYDLAVDYLEEALNWAVSKGDRLGEAKARTGLGELELQQGDLKQAVKSLEASVTILESLRPGLRDEQKISLAESQKRTYDLLQQAYVAQNKTDAALIVAERSRARAFIELLAQRTAAKKQQDLDTTPPSLPEIKAIAKNRQATLVSYSIIENKQGEESQMYVWVVNPQGQITFRQLDLIEIKQKFRTSVASVSRNSRQAAAGGLDLRQPRLQDYIISFRGDIRAKADNYRRKLGFPRDAYKMLITPIKDLLPQDPDELVVFIPQGSLFLVPFPALQNSAGEFLIEQHTLQISPAIQTLAVKQPEALDSSSALIVGNPAPMPESLSQLSGAEAEAQAIAEILGTTAIIGEAATEATAIAKMQQAKLIHLATHGLFDEQQGLQSSLAFSTRDNQDGFLTAEEILDLDLSANLVVLSACNTGRGKITGDGVVGLSRSFLLAGAQSTMVSLWYVPDLSTSALMTDFYRQLQEDYSQPQALRRAMLNTMETYPSPREWAAFILVGQ